MAAKKATFKKLRKYLKTIYKFTEVIRFSNGQQFGELALIKDVPRAATIITTKDTHFCSIMKDDYKHLLYKLEKRN
jgi:CRP-like cAMP-binding protein